MSTVKTYYRLTKPGIIYGNLLTTAGGFLLAADGHVKLGLFLATLSGTSLIIASACVFNNYIDRGIDVKMARTKKRALVSGKVSGRSALIYATVLGIIGVLILSLFTNALVVAVGLFALFAYVVLYGVGKRRTVHGTLIGSISGAAPPVAGYLAVTNHFDSAALLLFVIMVCWQMPHFYAIAMYRIKDYKAAGIPVLPIVKGMRATKTQIVAYIVAFITACSLLSVYGYVGYTYRIVMLIIGIIWLRKGVGGFRATDDNLWARQMFFFSLIVICTLSLMLAVGPMLP